MIGKQVLAFGKSEKLEFINIGIFAASSGGHKGRHHIGRFTPDRERSHVWYSCTYNCVHSEIFLQQPRQPLVTNGGTNQYHIINGSVAIDTDRYQAIDNDRYQLPPMLVTNGRSRTARYIKTYPKRRLKINNVFKHRVLRQLKLRHILVHVHKINQLLY